MVFEQKKITELARRIRYDIIMSTYHAKSGHPGGSLSAADAMAVLYGAILNHRPNEPQWEDRDRVILSKGHAAPVLYSALAESGYFDREILWTLRKLGSPLQGHPDKIKGPAGIEMSSGSLGQGLSIAVGLALGARLSKKSWWVYSIHGDGELDEGQIWEAAMSAAHFNLDNLCAIVDNNNLQIDGFCRDVMNLGSIEAKFTGFGWNAVRVDGHDVAAIYAALNFAKEVKGKPTAVILSTIKGKGVKAMENLADWHGKAPKEKEAREAITDLGFEWGELGGVK